MRFEVITIFPELFDSFLAKGLVARAHTHGVIDVVRTNPRDFAPNKHKSVDDAPYGGGSGMSCCPAPSSRRSSRRWGRTVHRSCNTEGKPFTSPSRAGSRHCGDRSRGGARYEGVDDRVRDARTSRSRRDS